MDTTKPLPEMNIPEPTYVDFDPVDDNLTKWRFKFPDYNQQAVEQLKEEVPSDARGYDPLTYEWTVDADYAGAAADVVRRNFRQVEILWGG